MNRNLLDVGRVLAGWAALLAVEHFVVGVAYRDEFAGAWELWPARIAAAPLFMGLALFAAAGCVALARLSSSPDPVAVRALAAVAGASGAAVGWGVSGGRHFATLLARGGLALAVAAVAIFAVYTWRALRRRVGRAAALVALGAALLAWWADAHVLVRLYPAMHLGLFGLSLAASALATLDSGWIGPRAARVTVVLSAVAALLAPLEAKKLRGYDNLRRVLVERAPWMGRAVLVGAWLSPPEALAASEGAKAPGEVARALDWAGRDILLVSIDALRADHVGAYGYARNTTPRIDALAREGTLFAHAYCPTPHTSYSVTSMMTGKYMRPLLALGLGEDSQTLASQLRRYGYRTAGFYPPAVFFIDETRFVGFEQRGLDFEYRKVEFADPALREKQLSEYLATADPRKPLFLWVHFFEPHEPYVRHPEHPFGETDLDAYDSEIATADDGVGRVAALVRGKRPNTVVIVTADHGEEFGDHGGRYHGTTVYEEQVRVPMLVSGPGVRAGATVDVPVQTIDLLPTILSAQGIPRPARVRGRDLGPVLARPVAKDDPGFAFAGTDDFTLLAKSSLRLVCEKQADACALFDVATDPGEKHDVAPSHGAELRAMRGELEAVARSHGRYEGQGADLPDALRRGAEGDVSAALEVAGLLDDADVGYRRKAAAILFDLRSPKVIAELRRSAEHDEDAIVRDTSAVALARVDSNEPLERARRLASSADAGDPSVARLAALAMAERGDTGATPLLVDWLGERDLEFSRARDIVAALGAGKARAAVPALVARLDDVRLRAYVADALGSIGDPAASAPLLAHLADERYVVVRPREAKALLALGVKQPLLGPLTRFAGLPEPMEGVLSLASSAGLLTAAHAGGRWPGPQSRVDVELDPRAPESPLRLGVLLAQPADDVSLEVDGASVALAGAGLERWADVMKHGRSVRVRVQSSQPSVLGLWLVPASAELPPPPPEPVTDAGM
ncbi:MAG TPA: sulfatase-like hydrolase/transferase [Polyangiaceae bacterium]|nr:sulfatase-like hydrolase/transferase [Polyangiaceae bacterium]